MIKQISAPVALIAVCLLLGVLCINCRRDVPLYGNFKANKVVVVIIDGPRYSETYGDPSHAHIPHFMEMAALGTVCDNFLNEGITNTTNGHGAICTGNYEDLNNAGLELPGYPSYLQHWIEQNGGDSTKAWVIASKDKLEVLSNCKQSSYHNRYRPSHDCGNNGLGTGYREDSITFLHILNVLDLYHPDVMITNFKEPDASGHANNWPGYLKGIESGDEYAWRIWHHIQADPYYRDKTDLFITNDHGRHPDGWKDGFVSHGDDCYGCRHINFLAIGPDFRTGYVCHKQYGQTDLSQTIAAILGIRMQFNRGEVMENIFR